MNTQNGKDVKNVNECLVKLKGTMLYQKVFVFLLIVVFIAGNRFLTMYPFLQLYPALNCVDENTGLYSECTVEQACALKDHLYAEGNPLYEKAFIIDQDASITLNNWMTNLNLVCNERWEIGL